MSYAKIILGKRGFKQARVPQVLSSEISQDGTQLALQFDQFITSATPLTGWALEVDNVSVALSTAQISGAQLTMVLATAAGAGATATLSYTAGTIVASDGGLSLGDFADAAVTNLSLLNPPARISGPTVDATGRYITIGFNQSITASSPLAGWSAAGVTFDAAEVAATAITLHTTAPILSGASVTVVYDDATGTAAGTAGYALASFSAAAVNNSTIAAPQVSGTPAVAASGASIAVAWDRAVDSATPTDGWTLTVAGSAVAVVSGSIAGSTLTLVPASTIPQGAAVTLAYSAGAGAIVAVAGGVAALAYGTATITNNSTAGVPAVSGTPSINSAGNLLTITISEAVTATTVGTGWVLTAGGLPITLSGGLITGGTTITFSLGSVVESGLSAALSYSGGTVVATDGGLSLAAYSGAITNGSTITRPTISGTPAVASGGMTTAITLGQSFTGASVAGWTLRADAVIVPVSGFSVSGNIVTLEHSVILDAAAAVTLQYDAPPGAIIGSTGGLAMLSVAEFAITNGSTRALPTYVSGTVGSNGTSVIANFSEALNAAMNPLLGFTLAVTPGTGSPYTITPDAATYTSTHQITFTFNEVIYNTGVVAADIVRLTYDDTTGEIEADSGGVDTASFTAAVVANGSGRVRPYITAAALQPNGLDVLLTFNEALDTGVSVTSGFQYKLNGSNVSLHGSGNAFGPLSTQITHRLAALVFAHTGGSPQVVTLDYTPGAIVDVSPGDAMLAASGQAVTNGSMVTPLEIVSAEPTANGRHIVLTFSADLDTGTSPLSGFNYNGGEIAIGAAAFGPGANSITHVLATGSAVYVGDTVTLDYIPGTLASVAGVALLAETDYPVDTSGATTAWTPALLPGIIDFGIWSDLSRLKQNTAGTTAVTAAGQAVRWWRGQRDTVTLRATAPYPYKAARLAATGIEASDEAGIYAWLFASYAVAAIGERTVATRCDGFTGGDAPDVGFTTNVHSTAVTNIRGLNIRVRSAGTTLPGTAGTTGNPPWVLSSTSTSGSVAYLADGATVSVSHDGAGSPAAGTIIGVSFEDDDVPAQFWLFGTVAIGPTDAERLRTYMAAL